MKRRWFVQASLICLRYFGANFDGTAANDWMGWGTDLEIIIAWNFENMASFKEWNFKGRILLNFLWHCLLIAKAQNY